MLKKIIITSFITIFTLSSFISVSADEDSWGSKTVTVTEKIPGAGCKCAFWSQWDTCELNEENKSALYTCSVGDGFDQVMVILWNIIKYFTFLAGLGWVLFIIINGIMYSMWGLDDSMKSEAKKRILGTIIGLVLLLMSGVILRILAPWIYV